MKYASTAVLALLSHTGAVKLSYDEAEGPTMVDFGESDNHVLEREGDIKNGEKAGGWTNPLGWEDDGDNDESVLSQLRSQIRMKYDESEGPTMVDFGESDPHVLEREGDIKNGEKAGGWTNPLGWEDNGDDDESVITQLKADIRMSKHHKSKDEYDNDENTVSVYDSMEHHKKFDWGVETPSDFQGAMIKTQRKANQRDAYDHDENTASPYDAMEKHQKFDWGLPTNPKDFEGAQIKVHSRRAAQKKDAYDHDDNTASVYDAMEKHQKFDWGVPKPTDFEGAQIRRNAHKKDAYDGDEDTASVYDEMVHHKKHDFGVKAGEHGALKPEAFVQKHHHHHRRHHH